MKLFYPKPLITLFLLFFFNSITTAQPPSFGWVRTLGSAGANEHVQGMVLDSAKSVTITGGFYNTVDFNAGTGTFNLTSNGSMDTYICRYTSNGNFLWAKSLGSSFDDIPRAFAQDRQGNLYVMGIFQGTTDFDPGPGVFNLTNLNGSNSYLLKLDKDGNFLWVKSWQFFCFTLDIDDAGNILVGGEFGNTRDFDPGPGTFNMTSNLANFDDMCIIKLDNSGNFTWAKQFRNFAITNQFQQHGLETDPAGNILFAGSFSLGIDFDPGPGITVLTSAGSIDAFLVKLNSQGEYQWVKQFGASGTDGIAGLEVDRQGNVFSTGAFGNTVDFDPGPGSFLLTAPGPRCAFISKLDPAGNFVYAKNFQSGDTFGQSLAIDSTNNLYVSGGFHSTVDFDPGPGAYNIPTGDLFTVKLDPNGSFSWAAGYIPSGPSTFESVYSVVLVDPFNSVYFGGSFPTTVDWDPGPGTFNATPNGSGWDLYIHKLGPAPCAATTGSSITAQACNSYVLNGITYTNSGVFYQQRTNAAGCDSIITLNLTLNAAQQTNLTHTNCGPYTWNNRVLNSSGIYRDTVRLQNGCDSITILNLTVNAKPVPNLGMDTVLCVGDTIRLSAGNFSTYVWSNGSSLSTLAVTQPGAYWVNVAAANGCTARDTVNISASATCITCFDPAIVQRVYPAPLRKTLTVELRAVNCGIRMDIYNILGQLLMKGYVLSPGKNDINLDRLPPSMYFYRIYNGETMLRQGKLLKQ